MKIPMSDTDRVVTAFPHRDKILVVTVEGELFVIEVGENFATDELFIRQA